MSKTFVIGLDGGTFDLLLPLMEQGLLPALQSAMQRGAWGRLNSTMPPFTATAWSSFITGQNAGKHGILSFQERDAFNYDLVGSGFLNATRHELTLWEVLSQLGQTVGVVNVPFTYPVRPVNGYMISGMMTPSGVPFTYPDELAAELDDYQIDVTFIREGVEFKQGGFPSQHEMLAEIREVQRKRIAACTKLLSERPTDFFMVVLTSTDRISHFLWDVLIALAQQQPIADAALRDAVLDYLRELDAGIATMLDFAQPDDHVFFLSDHGFGAAPTRRFFPNVWLEEQGWLQTRSSKGSFDLEALRVKIGRNPTLKKLVQSVVPSRMQTKAREVTEQVSGELLDWSQTQAYTVPIYFHVFGIEINAAGLRRDGVVSAETYEPLRDAIITQLKTLIAADGTPIIHNAWRREDIYAGQYVETFPDIIVELNPAYMPMTSLASSQLTEPAPPAFRPGEHRQDGMFIATGPAIAPASNLAALDLLDTTATILHASQHPIPERFDSAVMQAVFTTAFQSSNPVKQQQFTAQSQDSDDLSEEQAASLAARLRGLGYVE